MRIGDTQLTPIQGCYVLLSIVFSFTALIVHLKLGQIPIREKTQLKSVLVPPKIEVAKDYSVEELLKKVSTSVEDTADDEVIILSDTDDAPAKYVPKGKINLNTADFDELMELPDITERTAKSIIEYRNKMGEIWELDELKGLPGIDSMFINRIRRKAILE